MESARVNPYAWTISVAEAIGSAALLAALVLLLLGDHLLRPLPRALLFCLVGASLIVAVANTLEWTGLFSQADLVESLVWPLVPTLCLFLFAVNL